MVEEPELGQEQRQRMEPEPILEAVLTPLWEGWAWAQAGRALDFDWLSWGGVGETTVGPGRGSEVNAPQPPPPFTLAS